MKSMQTLRRNGLPQRLADFFRDNPGEELLYEDARIKFDCTAQQLSDALGRLRAVGGGVESVHVIRARAAA